MFPDYKAALRGNCPFYVHHAEDSNDHLHQNASEYFNQAGH